MKRKTKQTLKTLALSVLGIGALVGVASGINTLAEKQDTELKTIYPTFEVGGLKDADGKYEESTATIYTKDAFECQGLEIALDFDNNIKYQVFYYENDGDFVSCTDVLLGNQDLSVPLSATHARIEVTPNWSEMGEDYAKEKDQEIKWYEVAKYATQLDIKVNDEQIAYEELVGSFANMENLNISFFGKGIYNGTQKTLTKDEAQTNCWYNPIDLTDYSEICVKYLYNDYKKGEIVEFVEIGPDSTVWARPIEISHFVDGDYVYVIVDTATMNGEYSLHTKVSSSSCELFEIFA